MHPLRRLSAVAHRALPCIVVLGLLNGCGRSASEGDELVVPEPAATRFSGTAPDADVPGPFEVSAAIDYRYGAIPGTLNVNDDGSRADTYPIDMDVLGVIRYPLETPGTRMPAGGFPVLLFQHGRHSTCSTTGDASGRESSGTDCEANGLKPIRSDLGYDYIAEILASWGYVVISIDANDINAQDANSNDRGITSRAELILHHLDIFRDIARHDGSSWRRDLKGNDFSVLTGRMNFSQVGLMGHSRGGNGVSKAVAYNRDARFDEPASTFDDPHQIKAVFALAPTDFANELPTDTVWATLSPYCDGDVTTLHGVYMYDHTRYLAENRSGTLYQLTVMGANHNYFNDYWFNDDSLGLGGPYCSEGLPRSGRLSRQDQRRTGAFLLSSFLRLFVGGETKFSGYWNALQQLPSSACPGGSGSCDEGVHLSFHQPSAYRLAVDSTQTDRSLASNDLGGANRYTGFLRTGWCAPNGSSSGNSYGLAPDSCPSPATISKAPQLFLQWIGSGAELSLDLGGVDARDYDFFTLRMGVSVIPDNAAGQDFTLTLVDGHGTEASADASAFSDALYFPPGFTISLGDAGAKTVMNMVPFRLDAKVWADAKLDLSDLRQARLRFSQRPTGTVQFTDVQFQKLPIRPSTP